MLLERRSRDGILDGTITVLYRRWQRPQVLAGRTYWTNAGRLDVLDVEIVDPALLTDQDAPPAGYTSVSDLVADLHGRTGDPVYRLEVRLAGGPDPRQQLGEDTDLGAADLAEIHRRLDRLDRTSRAGPWTATTLALIAGNPGVRAGDLAESIGREMAPFKLDVRKLKALGLTVSLPVGYRLSPRGEAFRRATPAD